MAEDGDLVVVALGGVQAFIAESRTTADLAAASGIMSGLAAVAARAAAGAGARLVFPERALSGAEVPSPAAESGDLDAVGVPNRVVVLAEPGTGPQVAERAAGAVRDAWASWVRREFPTLGDAAPDTPGFPDVSWVCVPAERGDYATKWVLAQRALAARRSVRAFEAVDEPARPLCSLSPRWAASEPPPKARRHHRGERLSRANWIKRQRGLFEDGARFPSTYAIASATFRQKVDEHWTDGTVVEAVQELHEAVSRLSKRRETPVPGLARPGGDRLRAWLAECAGGWVYPERWRVETLWEEIQGRRGEDLQALREKELPALAARGERAARALIDHMRRVHGVPAPAIYLAVIVQDLDGMGEFLSTGQDGGPVTVHYHRSVSRTLIELAGRQAEALRSRKLLGVPVYAGGDDLLAFTPAATALQAAAEVNRLVEETAGLPHASTAVLFFHHSAQLRRAVVEVQRMLKEAKSRVPGKHALAVGYLRRSGVREETIQPWAPTRGGCSPQTLFDLLSRHQEFVLSPRLVADLERDAAELAGLRPHIYEAELRRLVGRHVSGGDRDGREQWVGQTVRSLLELGAQECSSDGSGVRPVPLARVGVFLRQEAR